MVLYFDCFFIGTISCFMSKFSTVPKTSFKLLFGLFLIGLTCKEGIIIFLFIPTLDMLHSLVFVFQNLLNFWEVNISFLSLSLITSIDPSYSDHGKKFNKSVINISSSIICPVFDNSVCFFFKKANQSIGFCLTFSSL